MDLQALMGTLLSADALEGLSGSAGVSAQDAGKVLSAALPQLLQGAQAQADGADTAQSFANALAQHGQADTSDLLGFLQQEDTDDGAKIVSHLLGSQREEITKAAAQQSGLSSQQTAQILAAAAPLLMSLLGQQTGAGQQQNASANGIGALMGSLLGNVDTFSLITGLLGGTASGKKKPGAKKDDAASALGGLLTNLLK